MKKFLSFVSMSLVAFSLSAGRIVNIDFNDKTQAQIAELCVQHQIDDTSWSPSQVAALLTECEYFESLATFNSKYNVEIIMVVTTEAPCGSSTRNFKVPSSIMVSMASDDNYVIANLWNCYRRFSSGILVEHDERNQITLDDSNSSDSDSHELMKDEQCSLQSYFKDFNAIEKVCMSLAALVVAFGGFKYITQR